MEPASTMQMKFPHVLGRNVEHAWHYQRSTSRARVWDTDAEVWNRESGHNVPEVEDCTRIAHGRALNFGHAVSGSISSRLNSLEEPVGTCRARTQ